MKGRYGQSDRILDAGCGGGRNLHWFLQNDHLIYGVDRDEDSIRQLQSSYPSLSERFRQAPVEELPFADNYFDHVISSAVLHFAESTSHFHRMLAEMLRVLRPGGSLFIRMTSDIGIEDHVQPIGDGVYLLPDGSRRFLLTRPLLAGMVQQHKVSLLEPLKTVNVSDMRCMSTLVAAK